MDTIKTGSLSLVSMLFLSIRKLLPFTLSLLEDRHQIGLTHESILVQTGSGALDEDLLQATTESQERAGKRLSFLPPKRVVDHSPVPHGNHVLQIKPSFCVSLEDGGELCQIKAIPSTLEVSEKKDIILLLVVRRILPHHVVHRRVR